MKREFIDKLLTIVDKNNVYLDEPMSRHTTFRIGGNADVFIEIAADEIEKVIEACNSEDVAYTDGVYLWGNETIYYFEKYNLKLPDSFIAKAL